LENNVVSRRLALLASHGAFLLFVEHIVWDGAIAGRELLPSAKTLIAAYVLCLFVGAAVAYLSLIIKGRRGAILEAASAVLLAIPLLYHVISISDVWG